jgi:hypothetical protein
MVLASANAGAGVQIGCGARDVFTSVLPDESIVPGLLVATGRLPLTRSREVAASV